MPRLAVEDYVAGIRAGDRFVLSRAITLTESQLLNDQQRAERVLEAVFPDSGRSLRIGITGVPGVGKSTFIEAFGQLLTGLGHRLAVLAVDPSSQRTGGSILGDKTRMDQLSVNPNAYIRPSPAGNARGGVGHRTREAMLLCEAAGFDIILVETVGVGQSETLVWGMTDFFLLLLLAGAGDELQGMKRGIMELADALAITKADTDNQPAAARAQLDYQNALHLFPPTGTGWQPSVLTCSSLTGAGLSDLWQRIQDHQTLTRQTGHHNRHRQAQQTDWFRALLREALDRRFFTQPGRADQLATLNEQVRSGAIWPGQAVRLLLDE
jgi:LAO/AO transport system kinase